MIVTLSQKWTPKVRNIFVDVQSTQSCLTLRPCRLQHARLSCLSPTPGACLNSCPSSQWCHPTISSSVVPVSACLQSFPAAGYFPMSWLFLSGGQSIGNSVLASVLQWISKGWFLLGLIGLILQFKEFSRVFSTTVQKHQFFVAQPSLWPSSPIHTWLLENHRSDYMELSQKSKSLLF